MVKFKYLSIFLQFSQGNRKSFGLIVLIAYFFFILEGCGGRGFGGKGGAVSSGELEIITYNNISSGSLLKDNDDLSNLIKPIEATGSEKDVIFHNVLFKDVISGYKTKLDLVAVGMNNVDVKNNLLGAQDIIENKVLKGDKALTLFSEGKVFDSISKQTYCQEISEKLMGDSSFFVLDANTGSCKFRKHPRVFVTTAELKKAVQVFLSKKPNTKITIAYKPCCDGLVTDTTTKLAEEGTHEIIPNNTNTSVNNANIKKSYFFKNFNFDEKKHQLVWEIFEKEGTKEIATNLPKGSTYELELLLNTNNGKNSFSVNDRKIFPSLASDYKILNSISVKSVSFRFSLVLYDSGVEIQKVNLDSALSFNCKKNSACQLEKQKTISRNR